jgi:hypothetical protein
MAIYSLIYFIVAIKIKNKVLANNNKRKNKRKEIQWTGKRNFSLLQNKRH